MSQADLLARLEAVTVRLERAASRMGGRGGGDDDGDETPEYVTVYASIVSNHLPKVQAACAGLGIEKCGDLLKSSYDVMLDLVSRVPKSKKPGQQDLMAFLKPAVDAITEADNMKYKGKNSRKFGDHYKAIYEALVVQQWVFLASGGKTPAQFIQAQRDAMNFNLLRVQKMKNYDDKNKAFVKTLQDFYKALAEEFGQEFFKKDWLTWNAKGGELNSVSGGVSVSTGGDDQKEQAKPKAAPAKKAGGGGGLGAVFGSINKLQNAGDRSKLLKGKVTDKDKTKNRKDRSGKVVMKKAPKKAGRKKGAPKISYRGGAWWAENHNEEDGVIQLEKANMKSNVYIAMGDNSTYQIKNKVKAITIDSCNKCRVFVTEVVSVIEVVNCKSLKLIVQGKAPSITVDKSEDPHLILTKEGLACEPGIFTSNVSNMNIQVPGKTDNDDPIEIPVPYQFKTTIDPKTKTISTEEVKHEG